MIKYIGLIEVYSVKNIKVKIKGAVSL